MSIKDLINNPVFVAGLSASALLYLAVSVGMPLLNESDAVNSNSSDTVPPPNLFGETASPLSGLRNPVRASQAFGSRGNIQWLDEVTQDPFRKKFTQPVTQKFTTSSTRAVKLPTLTALFVGTGIETAVLNDRMLEVGDKIDGFTIAKIEPHQVQLKRGQKNYWLEPGHD